MQYENVDFDGWIPSEGLDLLDLSVFIVFN